MELNLEKEEAITVIHGSLPQISRTQQSKGQSVVTSSEFEKVFFLVIFIPFISSNTPKIKSSELEYASSKTRIKNMSAVDLTRLLLNKRLPANTARLPRDFSDNYINLISSVVETPRSTRKPRSIQSRIVLKDKFKSGSLPKRKHFKSATSPGAPFRRKLMPNLTRPKRRSEKTNKSFAVAKTHRIFNRDVEHLGYSFDRTVGNVSMLSDINRDSTRRNVLVEVVPLKSGRPPRYRSQRTPRAVDFQF
mmetsp:Transcript_33875/g.59031  ORF Transcript_33875/g.59031 Transcript_33875/m.59031 type:complete len:248 (+) Transcript_33875:703-1446(+)